jgi:hypothetical protein
MFDSLKSIRLMVICALISVKTAKNHIDTARNSEGAVQSKEEKKLNSVMTFFLFDLFDPAFRR